MEKEFVPYELAVKLKELGFDELCFGHYWEKLFYFQTTHTHPSTMPNSHESCLAPTFSQAFRWFREKYKIGTWIHHYFDVDKGDYIYSWVITLPHKDDGFVYETYEEAELACLTKLIEIVQGGNNE